MRINKYIAAATEHSRRAADKLIDEGRVTVDGIIAKAGQDITTDQTVRLGNRLLKLPESSTTIMLNKPAGYVVSRNGQGSQTIYELLPERYIGLNPIGRLDKDSSGLLLLTNDGKLTQILGHPSGNKLKIYEIELSKPLEPNKQRQISSQGVKLDDGVSRLGLAKLDRTGLTYRVTMTEGRNRQIRRTFEGVGHKVIKLNRIKFGDYTLGNLQQGKYLEL